MAFFNMNPSEENVDQNGMNALHHAACKGSLKDVQKFVVRFNFQVNKPDEDGKNPLHYAAEEGHIETVRFLLSKGASVSLKDEDGCTPLHLAVMRGHLAVVRCFIEEAGVDPNQMAREDENDEEPETPLRLAKLNHQIEVVDYLEKIIAANSAISMDIS